MTKKRLEELLDGCIGYIFELKDNESKEERKYFWKKVIDMTDEEIKRFGVLNDD